MLGYAALLKGILPSMTDNLVTIKNVTFSYPDRTILQNIDLHIPRGKVTAIMGPSGSGKTTLLRLISAQVVPDEGEILVDGENLHQLSAKDLYAFRENMGMLFQSGALFTNLDVFENVAFPLREHTSYRKAYSMTWY